MVTGTLLAGWRPNCQGTEGDGQYDEEVVGVNVSIGASVFCGIGGLLINCIPNNTIHNESFRQLKE